MASCTNFLSLPFQSRQGRALDRTTAPLPDGAVAMFSFGARLYIIKGRSFNNADLAVTVRWGDETVYLAFADGIDTRGGDIRLDLPPGIYDLVKVDPFGGEIQTNVIVKDGASLIPRSGQPFVQIVYAFPAGLLKRGTGGLHRASQRTGRLVGYRSALGRLYPEQAELHHE